MGGVYSENIFDFKGMKDNLLPGDCPAVIRTFSWVLGWGTGLELCSCLAFCIRCFPSTTKRFIKKKRDILIYSFFFLPFFFWFYLSMKEMYMWIICSFLLLNLLKLVTSQATLSRMALRRKHCQRIQHSKVVCISGTSMCLCACGSHNQCWASGFRPWIFNTCSHQ